MTGKIGCFGSTFGHLTYQNLEFEGCMLGTLSQGISKNSFHHQQNNWWKKTVFLLPPNHVFQPAQFIGEIAYMESQDPLVYTIIYLSFPLAKIDKVFRRQFPRASPFAPLFPVRLFVDSISAKSCSQSVSFGSFVTPRKTPAIIEEMRVRG